jgi:spoIIIJ-associated protein
MDVHARVSAFMNDVLAAMGLSLAVQVNDTPDGVRIDLSGDGGEVLLRRKAEALEALQQIVLKDDRSFVIDCLGYRRARDTEVREMARFMMQKAKSSGAPQEMGPLNPYARRLVHLTVAEDPEVSSESIGDAFLKTVIISTKR